MQKKEIYLITGGLGFIGSNLIKLITNNNSESTIINYDKNTYAGNKDNLKNLIHKNYYFVKGDIQNKKKLYKILLEYKPDYIINLAAETHVDKSINNANEFINTNVKGTYQLLEALKDYQKSIKKKFKVIHVSTDEVYGSLRKNEKLFSEQNKYLPNSPYAATKASSDLLVRAYIKTYNLPICITNCSNNYGHYQHPEKLIPVVISSCQNKKSIPVYGNGMQIRDWLHVDDHCEALLLILKNGRIGESYNIGGGNEINNLKLIKLICKIMDKIKPANIKYQTLIKHVKDRPAHDYRYAINFNKLKKELKWSPLVNFEKGIYDTVLWYNKNKSWVNQIKKRKSYKEWDLTNYKNRGSIR